MQSNCLTKTKNNDDEYVYIIMSTVFVIIFSFDVYSFPMPNHDEKQFVGMESHLVAIIDLFKTIRDISFKMTQHQTGSRLISALFVNSIIN